MTRLLPTTFTWGSIQVNECTISAKHVDRNNVGPSVMILLGEFSRGDFVTEELGVEKIGKGQFVGFDGTVLHVRALRR